MYKKAIWPPKPSEPPKPTLGEGWVIQCGTKYFVTMRTCLGGDVLGSHGLRLFEISGDGRLLSYNRHSDLAAFSTDQYKFCTAIWRTVADFVADMDRESGKNSTGSSSEVSKLIDYAGRHIECDTLERNDVQSFLKMLRGAINTSAR